MNLIKLIHEADMWYHLYLWCSSTKVLLLARVHTQHCSQQAVLRYSLRMGANLQVTICKRCPLLHLWSKSYRKLSSPQIQLCQ